MTAEFGRVCLLKIFPSGKGIPSTASGYLIAPHLVLTASHAVKLENEAVLSAEVEARFPDSGIAIRGRVIWCGDKLRDAALVLLNEDASARLEDIAKRTSRWGLLTGVQPGIEATSIGFPRVLRDSNRTRVPEQLKGTINPGVASGGWYDILVTGPLPEASDTAPRPWAGMSGAAVFVDDLIIGVVSADLPAWSHGRLRAVPLHTLLQDSEFTHHLAEHGCRTWAESVELAPLLYRQFSHLDSPASLLRADNEVVAFYGRDELLWSLKAWCTEGENLSLRLLTGPGGQGKTRLALQLISDLRKQHWAGGFLADADSPRELINHVAESTWPVLLVVDYAESRADQIRQLVHAITFPSGKVRILLLARSAGDWWDDLSAGLQRSCGVINQHQLPPVANSIAAYNRALRDLATGLSRLHEWSRFSWDQIIERLPRQDLDSPMFESILTVQLQAIVNLLGAAEQRESEFTPARDLEQLLLAHERAYWIRTAGQRGLTSPDYPISILEEAVVAAVLTGADSEEEAIVVLSRVRALSDVSDGAKHTIARWIANMYPPSASAYWGSLQPDRVGDAHIADTIEKRPALLPEILHGADAHQLHHASIVLARAMHYQPRLAAHVVDLLAAKDLDSILAYADPYLMLDALRNVDGATAHAVAEVYRKCAHLLHSQDPGERASELELAARQMGHLDLAERISAAYPNRPLHTRWVHRPHESTLAVVLDRAKPMQALAITKAGDHDVLLIADNHGHVMSSSLDGDPRPRTVARHQSPVDHLLTVVIDDDTHLICIDRHGGIWLYDLDGGRPSQFLTHPDAHQTREVNSRVTAATIAQSTNRPLLVTARGSSLFTTRLSTKSAPVTRPLISLPGQVTAVVPISLGKESVIIAACGQQVYRINLASRATAQLLLQHPTHDPEPDPYHARSLGRSGRNALAVATLNGMPWVASGDSEGKVQILELQKDTKPNVIAAHKGPIDAIAMVEVNGRLSLVSSSPRDRLKSTWLDEVPPKPQPLLPHRGSDYSEYSDTTILELVDDPHDGKYVLFANNSSRGVWAIPLSKLNRRARFLASTFGQVTAIATGISGGRAIVASAHGTESSQGVLLISRLPAREEDERFGPEYRIYEMALGYKGERPVLVVQHSGGSQGLGSDQQVTAYWLDADPDPATFFERKDCYWHHDAPIISARNHRAISRLPHDIFRHASARSALSFINGFIRERGKYFEIKRYVDDNYKGLLYICSPDPPKEDEVLLLEHDQSIVEFCVRQFGGMAVILFSDGTGRLISAVRRDGNVTTRTLAVHAQAPGSVRGAWIGDEYLIVSANNGPAGEVWASWLTSDQPSAKIATLDDDVQDITIMQHETQVAVVISHGNGKLTITGLTDETGDNHSLTTVQFGESIDKLLNYEQTILIGTSAGVATLDLNHWSDLEPVQGNGTALGSEATDWASLLSGYRPLPRFSEGASSRSRLWVPWLTAAAIAVAMSAVAIVLLGHPWLVPAWLYLGYAVWSDYYTEWGSHSSWWRRYLTALALLAIPAGLEGHWDALARGMAAVPISIIVIGLLSIERAPGGQPSYRFWPTLQLTSPRTWRDLSAGLWQTINRLTYAQGRSYLAGFLGLFLAYIGWNSLIVGAILPVTAGVAGRVYMHFRYHWFLPCDGRAVLLLGGVIGVLAPIPAMHLLSKFWLNIIHSKHGSSKLKALMKLSIGIVVLICRF